MQRSSAILVALVLAGLLGGSGAAFGQGFGVFEQSACMTGRGVTGVASPCSDGSGVYFNPAGISFDSTQVSLGSAFIGPRGDFTDNTTKLVTTLNKKWYPVPNVYFTTPVGKKLAVGVGLFAPYGLTTDWPENSQGRFLGYKSVVQGIYVQPTVAYKLSENVSIGVGLDITYLNVELRQRADLSVQQLTPTLTFAALGVKAGTDFADVQLKGNTMTYGANIGVIAKLSDKVSAGARWMTGRKVAIDEATISTTQIPAVKADGSPYVLPITLGPTLPAGTKMDLLVASQFASGGKLSNQSGASRIPLPDQIVVGLAVQATPKLKLLADYQFTKWSLFDELPIDGQYLKTKVTESYKDTHGIRLGAELNVGEATVVRAGFDGHGAAAPDQTVTPNLPEGKRVEFMGGVGTRLSSNLHFDFAYLYLHQYDRDGRTGGKEPATVADNNGVYKFMAHIFSAAFSLRF